MTLPLSSRITHLVSLISYHSSRLTLLNAFKISLFIFCVLGMLSFLCWIWPTEPVMLTLNWPSMKLVLQTDDVATPPAEETVLPVPSAAVTSDSLGMTPAAVAEVVVAPALETAEEVEELVEAPMPLVDLPEGVDPAGIFFPDNDITYLDPFFRALDQSNDKHVRIIHYGDSQIEEDRISAKLRNNMQEKFGGWGTGLQPAMRRYSKPTLKQTTYPELPYSLLFGKQTYSAKDGFYGPMMQVSRVNGKATIDFKPSRMTNYAHSRRFDHIGVLADGHGSIEVVTPDSTYCLTLQDTLFESMQQFYADLPLPVVEAKVIFKGQWNVYGLMLDGQYGVNVDNIPMRGYSGITFNRNKPESMSPFFDQQNVSLIIFQFGGNSVPGLKSDRSIAEYKERIGDAIDYFHRIAPEACILMIGPSDMATIVNGRKQTYPFLPKVVKALREAALSHHAAYWSLYDAMGGWGSMLQWVKARPQLAGEDYVHFTRKGADKMADCLNELLMEHYHNYRQRQTSTPIDHAE